MERLQFTIRSLLWATFWTSVCAGAWTLALRYFGHQEDPAGLAILVLALFVGVLTPGVAVGALFGRARTGFKINALILGGVSLVMLVGAVVKVAIY